MRTEYEFALKLAPNKSAGKSVLGVGAEL